MKKRVLYIIGVLLLLQTTQSVMAQKNTVDGWSDIIIQQFDQKGDTLYVKFHLDMSGIKMKSKQALSYTPIISTPTKSINLPKISLRGRNNYKEYIREITLMSKKERATYDLISPSYANVKAFGRSDKRVYYEYAIPYEDWMSNSKLMMESEISRCVSKNNIELDILLANITLDGVSIPSILEKIPTELFLAGHISEYKEDIKTIYIQQDKDVFEIYFPWGVSKIDGNYMSNTKRLIHLKNLLNEIVNSTDLNLAKVFIVGFSSIEGSLKTNKSLSSNRTKSIYNYILSNTKVNDSLIEIYNGAENWNGLRHLVIESDIKDKTAILDIIDNVPITQGRETRLMNLNGGDTYRYMREHFFSKLRYVYIKIYFDNNKPL